MIYIFNRDHSVHSNYLNPIDRAILSWSDSMQLQGYSSLILHRYKLPRSWTQEHPNRYQYKNLLDLKTNLIKEENVILLHNPDKVGDVYQLLKDPYLAKKDWWLFGLSSNYQRIGYLYDLDGLGLEYEMVKDLNPYLQSLSKKIIRDRKLAEIFNI